jgi:hypothetical protein
MANSVLSDPVSRWTIQARLHATDEQWEQLQPHLRSFVAPAGLILYDWPTVVAALRQLTHAKKPIEMAADGPSAAP